MKKYLLISFMLLSVFLKAQPSTISSEEKAVDFAIKNCDNKFIELPDLYPAPTKVIPEDKDEKLLLVQILKAKGFKVTNWGRGNNPPLGPRIIDVTLKKDQCQCDVQKIYRFTTIESEYTLSEKIKCSLIK